MSQPLTLKRFEQFVDAYTQNHAALVATLADHTERLDRLEQLLSLERRVDLIERRTKKLAEIAGHPELATVNF